MPQRSVGSPAEIAWTHGMGEIIDRRCIEDILNCPCNWVPSHVEDLKATLLPKGEPNGTKRID